MTRREARRESDCEALFDAGVAVRQGVLEPHILIELPIASLAEGEICPPLEPEHPTWTVISPWDDPLAKIRALYGKGTKKPTHVLRRVPGGPDLLGLRLGDTLHLFGAAC